MARLLVIDDQAKEFSKSLDVALEEHEIVYAADARAGVRAVERDEEICCVLLDISMPPTLGKVRDEEGIAALREIRKLRPDLPVLMLTASSEAGDMIRAIRMGAFHYVIKPPDTNNLRTLITAALANRELKEKVANLEATIRKRDEMASVPGESVTFGSMIGLSPAMRVIFGQVSRLASDTAEVLILGESGTGKELVAREIHARGLRADKSFIPVNCASLTGTLLESELFGHRKGAYTGADADRDGAFRAADGGTIFLDEIAEMSGELQAKLLRVLQEKKVKPLGREHEEAVDVRVVAATNKDVDALVREGKFREDLFYRLNVIRLVLPPLRERREDISVLAEHFLKKHAEGKGFFLGDDASRALQARNWPGNVRELENAIRRAIVLSDCPELGADSFPESDSVANATRDYGALWDDAQNGRVPTDINQFAELHGKLALAEMMRRAAEVTRTDREAGKLLGFIPDDDADDKAFNNYRSWKRRVMKMVENDGTD